MPNRFSLYIADPSFTFVRIDTIHPSMRESPIRPPSKIYDTRERERELSEIGPKITVMTMDDFDHRLWILRDVWHIIIRLLLQWIEQVPSGTVPE